MLTLENDNKLMELRKQLANEEMTTKNVANEVRSIDTNRVNELIGNYHNNGYNKLNDYSNRNTNITNSNDKTIHNNVENMYRNRTNIDLNNIEWGEVLYVNLDGGKYCEQNNDRFAICIQNQIGNKFSPTIIVAFVTSQQTKSQLPTHVKIPAGHFGLPKDSIIMLEQVRTLDKRRIISRVGMLDDITKKKVKIAKDISMNELQEKTPLEKLPQNIQDIIHDKLDTIRSVEKTISTLNDEYLINNLLEQRQCHLMALERICKKYEIHYKDYYVMYKKEDKKIVI